MRLKNYFILIFLLFFLASCSNKKVEIPPPRINIIPQPVSVVPKPDFFEFTSTTTIKVAIGFEPAVNAMNELFEKAAGWRFKTVNDSADEPAAIEFIQNKAIKQAEGYFLIIQPEKITIEAAEPVGAFYAVQTLRQLLPPEIEARELVRDLAWRVPCAEIRDHPRYTYRGMHLDVGRHFFPVSFIKKYIDLLAMHKMNRFHWHLTEDQGWRIEIKKYPKLQEIAAFRKETLIGHYSDQPHQFDGKRYGGYYTQEEAKEIIAYAQERYITVIPEIEMPGHSQAALAAYPELSCHDQPVEVATKWGVFENVYCPEETTFEFLEQVLLEVIELFPSEYIHIGGDECPKIQWKESAFCQELIKQEGLKDEKGLQSYFIRRIASFLNEKGRNIIGWDEILEGGLAPNATVMSWRGTQGGIEAAKAGHSVIMTPTSHCYFDYYQSRDPNEPLAIGGYLPLKKVYAFNPTPKELNPAQAQYVLGAQGNLWTEYITSTEKAEYMAFPRAIALAEVVWSPQETRNYEDFIDRLVYHFERLDVLEVNYADHLLDITYEVIPKESGGISLALSSRKQDATIVFAEWTEEGYFDYYAYEEPIPINGYAKIRAVFRNAFNEEKGRPLTLTFNTNKATGKSVELRKPPHENYNEGGKTALVNGIWGSTDRYGDGEWLGWWGDDFEATIDLKETEKLEIVKLRFFHSPGQWIYAPRKVLIKGSLDKQKWTTIGTEELPTERLGKLVPVSIQLKERQTRYLNIKVLRHGIIEEGAQGAGNEAWLFVDEIVVR